LIAVYHRISSFGHNRLKKKNIKFTFGVDNITEEEPPVVGGESGSTTFNSGNTFPSTYSAIGRVFKASVKFTF